jgi:FMN phosphatase YigB (HAD superfamily)
VEDVFVSEKMDSEKPNRKIFDAALRALGVENREHVLMVGDSLSSDVQGGVNAGLDTCWYNPNHAENPGKVVPTYEISSLEELSAGDGAGGAGQCGPEESPPPAVMLCGLCERLENEQC